MSEFYSVDYNYSQVSLLAGYRMYRRGARRVLGYGYGCPGATIPGPHWTGAWINTSGMGNHGEHVLIPVSDAARELVRRLTIRRWWHATGCTRRAAERLYAARCQWKRELAPVILSATTDRAAVHAMRQFPGMGRGHDGWFRAWEPVLTPYRNDLSWPRFATVIDAVRFLAAED